MSKCMLLFMYLNEFFLKVSRHNNCIYYIICTLYDMLSAAEVSEVLSNLECPDVCMIVNTTLSLVISLNFEYSRNASYVR